MIWEINGVVYSDDYPDIYRRYSERIYSEIEPSELVCKEALRKICSTSWIKRIEITGIREISAREIEREKAREIKEQNEKTERDRIYNLPENIAKRKAKNILSKFLFTLIMIPIISLLWYLWRLSNQEIFIDFAIFFIIFIIVLIIVPFD